MNDLKKTDSARREQAVHDAATDGVGEAQDESSAPESGLRARLRTLRNALQHRPITKTDLTKDRTRSLALVIGGTVGAVLLFLGAFSTPTRVSVHEMPTRTAPNLGRPTPETSSKPAQGSVTPLLHADVPSDDIHEEQLSPADIRGTARRSESHEMVRLAEANAQVRSARLLRRQASGSERVNSLSADDSDPLAADRRNNSTGAPTYSYGRVPVSTAAAELSRIPGYGAAGGTSNDVRVTSPNPVKSSIVFVRSAGPTEPVASTSPAAIIPLQDTLLPPGTRLVARLDSDATTAVKTPVVASIEYNYEREGTVIVPAGTKVVGELQQASSEGYLAVRFHTLEMPNGREETIEGTGVSLDHKPLKGVVSGKNTAKKLLSRTLSGAGTIAAYMVGAGGSGLGRAITGETLLRDRLAGNIALTGEQELMNAAYSSNINVTLPANMRFYVVLQKAAARMPTPAASRIAESAAPSAEVPTVQELRELMDLRREINRMYQESNRTQRPKE